MTDLAVYSEDILRIEQQLQAVVEALAELHEVERLEQRSQHLEWCQQRVEEARQLLNSMLRDLNAARGQPDA